MKRLFLTLLSISAVYAQTNGTANTQTTVAAGSSTIRTVQTKLREFASVADFGADPTGVVNSTPAFQAAVNAIASGASGLIWCDPGTYLLNTSVTTSGNHPLFWLEPGCTTTGAGSLSVTAMSFGASLFSVQTPIGLESVTVSSLPSASPAGQIIYASNGTPGSGPCVGSGTGATAFSTGSQWNCVSQSALPTGSSQLIYPRIQANTGNNSTYELVSLPTVNASDYTFPAQLPGGSIVGGGSNNITVPIMPKGMNGSDPNHYVYVSGGAGTPEACLISGGAGTAGGLNAALTINCANNHSGAWTITSVMGGIPEAIQDLATNYGYGQVSLGKGSITAYGPAYIPQAAYFHQVGAGAQGFRYRITGQGAFVSQIRIAASSAESGPDAVGFPLTATGVIVCIMSEANSIIGPEIDNLTIWGVEPDSTNVATYTQWPWGIYILGGMGSHVHDVSIFGWNGVNLLLSEGSRVQRGYFSTFGTGINADGNQDSMYFEDDRWWIYGMTTNQQAAFTTAANTGIVGINLGRNDDFEITKCFFINPTAINFYRSSAYSGGVPSGSVIDSHFDGQGQVTMSDGAVVFQGGTEGVAASTWLQLTGGSVWIQGMLIAANYCTMPTIRANFASASPTGGQLLTLIGNTITQPACDIGIVDVNDGGTQPAAVRIVGNTFVRSPAIAYATAMIGDFTTNAGSVVEVTGNTAENTGANLDYFTQVLTDGFKIVKNNAVFNAQISLGFSPPYLGEYETDQIKWTQPIQNQNYGGSVASATTIAIPQSSLPTKAYAQAFTVTGTGNIQTLTVPQGATGMTVHIVAAGAWSTVTGGNIATIFTASANTEYIWTLINGNWWIK